jgi:hypothetical protein
MRCPIGVTSLALEIARCTSKLNSVMTWNGIWLSSRTWPLADPSSIKTWRVLRISDSALCVSLYGFHEFNLRKPLSQ